MAVMTTQWTLLIFVLVSGCSSLVTRSNFEEKYLGPMVGQVTPSQAVIWARGVRSGALRVRVFDKGAKVKTSQEPVFIGESIVAEEGDFAGRVLAEGLYPSTSYAVEALFTDSQGKIVSRVLDGNFKTPPEPSSKSVVKFAWSGDVAGQNVCRDQKEGFPIFEPLGHESLDFFVGLGDMIYADGFCRQKGRYGNQQHKVTLEPSFDLSSFWKHWRYFYSEPRVQRFFGQTPYYVTYDDHEVVNDYGPKDSIRKDPSTEQPVDLMAMGQKAFRDYNPVVVGETGTGHRLYQKFSWGSHLDLFVLDTRSYRAKNSDVDSDSTPKSMLGVHQRQWLLNQLKNSKSTWKAIISSVPLSIPTGWPPTNGRDGWANDENNTGFENELKRIVQEMYKQKVKNVIWLTADVHFAQGVKYQPIAKDPDYIMWEWVAGPLNADFFPNLTLDATLKPERQLFFGPQKMGEVQSFSEAKRWFNYGKINIAESGELEVSYVNALGQTVYSQKILPQQ